MHLADLAVIGAYLLFITWFGAQFSENQRTLKDYFLGGRGAPWWAISLSIVSAETSTLTVIGTPAISFEKRRQGDGADAGLTVFQELATGLQPR